MRVPVALLMVCVACSPWLQAADSPRVYITDSRSWEVSGGLGGRDAFGGALSGGDRPQTAEIIKTFGERCPAIVINNARERADYVVLLDHEGGKHLIRRDNKVVVFNREGDAILSNSTRSLGNAVKDACGAIAQDWPGSRTEATGQPDASNLSGDGLSVEAAAAVRITRIEITSTPAGAEIEVDGSFVGHTPSSLELPAGEHEIAVRKSGYEPWRRRLKTVGGTVRLNTDLEEEQRAAGDAPAGTADQSR